MGFTQSFIAFTGLLFCIIFTYLLNESLYLDTDVTLPLGGLCNVNASGLLSPDTNSTDVRGLLYGPLSVRGTSLFAGFLSLLLIGLGVLAPSLDLQMDSVYDESWFILSGEPLAYVTGILYRIAALGTALLMFLSTILIIPVLQAHQGALFLVKDSLEPTSCVGLGLNEHYRLDRLQAMLVSASAAIVMVLVTLYSVRYDRKASLMSTL